MNVLDFGVCRLSRPVQAAQVLNVIHFRIRKPRVLPTPVERT